MLAEAVAGYKKIVAGVQSALRMGYSGELMVSMARGPYFDAAFRGAIMEACNSTAGVAPGTAFTTTPPFALWNPPASGKNLAILKLFLGYVSGTLGAGVVNLGFVASQTTVPTGGTELIPVCTLLNSPRGVGRAFTGSTFASTPAIIRPVWSAGAALATTAAFPIEITEILDEAIIVTQGSAIALQGLMAAGTSPLVILGMAWEEVDA
jgi:hypothetical protein